MNFPYISICYIYAINVLFLGFTGQYTPTQPFSIYFIEVGPQIRGHIEVKFKGQKYFHPKVGHVAPQNKSLKE